MTDPSVAGIESFRSGFGGRVLTPWRAGLRPRARGLERRHRPQAGADRVLRHRRRRSPRRSASRARSGLEIAVRGGGHNYAGHAVCDGGLMIHLGAMNGVTVDPGGAACGLRRRRDLGRRRRGDAAARRWRRPAASSATPASAGSRSAAASAGSRQKAGLSCDNLVAAEVVTADARIVRASRQENADLFWALRGGGGNFGVVTSFEFALHPVGPMVHLGLFFFGLDDGPEALRFARDFVKTLPAGRDRVSRHRPERAAGAVRSRAAPFRRRARAAGRRLRLGRGARRPSWRRSARR